MEQIVFVIAACALASNTMRASQSKDLGALCLDAQPVEAESTYYSWVGDDIFPATRRLFERMDRTALFWCLKGESGYVRVPYPKHYRGIEPFKEVEPISPENGLFTATRTLFGEDGESTFRAAFNPSSWDEQEKQRLTSTDTDPKTIQFEFPQSKILEEDRYADISGPVYLSLEINH